MDDSSTVTFHSMSSHGPAIIRVCPLPLLCLWLRFCCCSGPLVCTPLQWVGCQSFSGLVRWWSTKRGKRCFGGLETGRLLARKATAGNLPWPGTGSDALSAKTRPICLRMRKSVFKALPGLWLTLDLIILTQTLCCPQTLWKACCIALEFKTGQHPQRKGRDFLFKQTHNMPRSTHPGRGYHRLFTYAAVSKKNGWGTCGDEGMRELPLAFVIPKHGCVEESHKDVVLAGRRRNSSHPLSVSALYWFKMCLRVIGPYLRQVLSTSSSWLLQPVPPSAK